jgi:hypothetical protein
MRRQPERHNWKRDQDHQPDEVGEDERQHAAEDGREGHLLRDTFDDEHVHADRRTDQAKLDRHDDDDAEPDRLRV